MRILIKLYNSPHFIFRIVYYGLFFDFVHMLIFFDLENPAFKNLELKLFFIKDEDKLLSLEYVPIKGISLFLLSNTTILFYLDIKAGD